MGTLRQSFSNLLDALSNEQFEALNSLAAEPLNKMTGQKPKWEGASGHWHQIDGSFSTDDDEVILLIECHHSGKATPIPKFCTLLVRLMDIAAKETDSIVLGALVSTQGPQGGFSGSPEDQDAIGRLRWYFAGQGYPIRFWLLSDKGCG